MNEPKLNIESREKAVLSDDLLAESSRCVTIHKHEASCMWIAVLVASIFASMAVAKVADAWKQVELERVRAQQRVQIVEEAGNVSR